MFGTILIVHRQPRVRASARQALERAGHAVRAADQLPLSEIGSPDLLLVAWSEFYPVAESLSGLRTREGAEPIKVITLTPREEMRAAIRTLDHGADDCVGVPFTDEELTARVNACLRRPAAPQRPDRVSAGPIVLDSAIHQVLVDNRPVSLAPTEFRLMAFLLENQGKVFSRDELLRKAWGKHIKAGHRTVDVHVRRLRQQLEPFGYDAMIETVRGFGYRLRAERSAAPRSSC